VGFDDSDNDDATHPWNDSEDSKQWVQLNGDEGIATTKYLWHGNQMAGIVNYSGGEPTSITVCQDGKEKWTYKVSGIDAEDVTVNSDNGRISADSTLLAGANSYAGDSILMTSENVYTDAKKSHTIEKNTSPDEIGQTKSILYYDNHGRQDHADDYVDGELDMKSARQWYYNDTVNSRDESFVPRFVVTIQQHVVDADGDGQADDEDENDIVDRAGNYHVVIMGEEYELLGSKDATASELEAMVKEKIEDVLEDEYYSNIEFYFSGKDDTTYQEGNTQLERIEQTSSELNDVSEEYIEVLTGYTLGVVFEDNVRYNGGGMMYIRDRSTGEITYFDRNGQQRQRFHADEVE
jgi:hypothetical protein